MTVRERPTIDGGVEVTVNAASGNVVYTLPTGYAARRPIYVLREDSSGNTVTISPPSGAALDGVTDGARTLGPEGELTFRAGDVGSWESYGAGTPGADPDLVSKADVDLSNVTAATGRAALGLGNVATRTVGTSSGQVRDAADATYTNSRTPTTHASSHTAGGGDAVTVTIAQVTGLQTALDAKAVATDVTTLQARAAQTEQVLYWTGSTYPAATASLKHKWIGPGTPSDPNARPGDEWVRVDL